MKTRRKAAWGIAAAVAATGGVAIGVIAASGGSSHGTGGFGAAKASLIERALNEGAAQDRSPAVVPRRYGPVGSVRTPRPPEGIIDVMQPFASSVVYLDGRGWQHYRSGILTTVYAGAFTKKRDQGIVIVWKRRFELRPTAAMATSRQSRAGTEAPVLFETPGRWGSVKIIGARGDVLRLAAEHGPRLTFDLDTRRFRVVGRRT